MECSFQGKRALVTGASSGIGRNIAVALAKGGAEVFALAWPEDGLAELCAEQKGITPIVCDLSDWEKTREIVQGILPFELLVNNAGISYKCPFLDFAEEDLDKHMAVNLKPAINISQIMAKDLIARGKSGAIVNTSSVASFVSVYPFSCYCISKSALNALNRNMALELGPHGIRSNNVCPQYVDTKLARTPDSLGENLENAQRVIDRVPLGRIAKTEEVTSAVLFLLSDHASMINGTDLLIDGGITSCFK